MAAGNSYYVTSTSMYSTPGYAQKTDYASLESNLYDGVGAGIIWTGRSETAMIPGDVYGQIPGVVGLLVNELIRINACCRAGSRRRGSARVSLALTPPACRSRISLVQEALRCPPASRIVGRGA
jgi:hypothetical protein